MSDVLGATPPQETPAEPLGNSTEARTPEGTLKDSTQPLIKPSEETKETKLADTKADGEKPAGAPEKYEPFKAPEGKELSPELVTQAETTFKELNLTQEQGQKLVDFWNAQTATISDKLDEMVAETRNGWRKQIAEDKGLGNGTDNLSDASKKAVNDAITHAGDEKIQSALRQALDLTGAGDHPDIVRAFVAFGKKLGEGTAVKGGGPVAPKTPGSGRTAAQALYPNLPSSANG